MKDLVAACLLNLKGGRGPLSFDDTLDYSS